MRTQMHQAVADRRPSEAPLVQPHAPFTSISTTCRLSWRRSDLQGSVCPGEIRPDSPAVPPPLPASIWIGTKFGAFPATVAMRRGKRHWAAPPGDVRAPSAQLSAHPDLLLGRPPSPSAPPSDQLDATIEARLASSMTSAIASPPWISSCQAVRQANRMTRWASHAGLHRKRCSKRTIYASKQDHLH